MQKGNIKVGVVYGFAEGTSDYVTAHPVIVLDAEDLWSWHRGSGREDRTWTVSPEKRYTKAIGGWSSYSGAHGYLVLSGKEDTIPAMEALAKEFMEGPGNPDAVKALAYKTNNIPDIRVAVVNNRWITGPYDEAKNVEDERDKAREAKRKTERERANAEAEFMTEASEIIAAKLERPLSLVRDYSYDGKRASISFNDLAAFLGIKTPGERL